MKSSKNSLFVTFGDTMEDFISTSYLPLYIKDEAKPFLLYSSHRFQLQFDADAISAIVSLEDIIGEGTVEHIEKHRPSITKTKWWAQSCYSEGEPLYLAFCPTLKAFVLDTDEVHFFLRTREIGKPIEIGLSLTPKKEPSKEVGPEVIYQRKIDLENIESRMGEAQYLYPEANPSAHLQDILIDLKEDSINRANGVIGAPTQRLLEIIKLTNGSYHTDWEPA